MIRAYVLALVLLPNVAGADPSISAILSFNRCNNCHGGAVAPSIPADQGGFELLDPATNLSVKEYEPEKLYTIRTRYQAKLFNGGYRTGYLIWVSAGEIVDSGQVGLVSGLRNARVVTTANAAAANTLDVAWRAPKAGGVEINAFRIETNNASNTAGDAVSQSPETIVLSTGTTPPAPPQSDGGAGDSGNANGSENGAPKDDAANEPSAQNASEDVVAEMGGCAVATTKREHFPAAALAWVLLLVGLHARARRQAGKIHRR